MTSSILIRLGGLAAALGGTVYVGLILVADPYWLERLYYTNTIGYGFVAVLQPLGAMGAMAAIAALYSSRRSAYWRCEAYFSAVSIVGLSLAVGALTVGVVLLSYPSDLLVSLILMGLLVASAGMVLAGGLIMAERVLPWWCGVAIMGGSPFGMFLMMVPSMALQGSPEGVFWLAKALAALGGVVWVLVGYAVFQEAGRRPERPSRVR